VLGLRMTGLVFIPSVGVNIMTVHVITVGSQGTRIMQQSTSASNPEYPEPILQYPITYTMLLWQGIGSGIASSLPSLVSRSMLKQRRVLLRMQ